MNDEGFFQMKAVESTNNNNQHIYTNFTVIWIQNENSLSHTVIMRNQTGPISLIKIQIALLELVQSLTWFPSPSKEFIITEISFTQVNDSNSYFRVTMSRDGQIVRQNVSDSMVQKDQGKLSYKEFDDLCSFIFKKDILLLDNTYGIDSSQSNRSVLHIVWKISHDRVTSSYFQTKTIEDWDQTGPQHLRDFEGLISKTLDSVKWGGQYDWFIINSVIVSFGITIAIIGFFIFVHSVYRQREQRQSSSDDEQPILVFKN